MKKYIRSAVNPLENESVRTRSFIAGNPNTPFRTLKTLADDSDVLVRYRVANNPNTPLEILEKLAKDPYKFVREGVYLNSGAPVDFKESINLHDYSGEVEIKMTLEPEVDPDSAAEQIRIAFNKLGHAVFSDSTYVYNDVGEYMYSCICDNFYSEGEVYRAVDSVVAALPDVVIGLYDIFRMLN